MTAPRDRPSLGEREDGQIGTEHIPYEHEPTACHDTVAALVDRYTDSGAAVLDLGCGTGHVLAAVAARRTDLNLTGADTDEQCLDIARQRVPGATAVLVDLEADRYDLGEKFDVVVLCHVLEHLLAPVDALTAALATLKPGGHAVLAVPNPVQPLVLAAAVRRSHYVNRGHVYSWDRSHWTNFLERIQGLEVVEYVPDALLLVPPKWRRTHRVLEPVAARLLHRLPWLSDSNIAVVRAGSERPAG